MGGSGTMAWALTQPNRFATLTPMAFSMRWVLGEPPFDEAISVLKDKPVWLVCGGRDRRLADILELYEVMKRVGVDVQLSVYATRGHGGLEPIVEFEGIAAWRNANPLVSNEDDP